MHQPQHVLPLALYAPMSRGGGSPFEARTHYGCGKALHGRYPFRSRRRGIQRVFDAGAHKKKNPKKALEHYDYIASLYREVYGVSPSAELEAQKALAVQELYGSETSEDDIHTFLLEKEQETGAFCCDNNVFREIVNLHVREMRRNDTPAALMIVRLANRSIDPEKRAVYMKQMEVTLLNELRAGDPFTKVGANQFWVLLPGATGENGGLVSRRVFNRFQKEYPKSGAAYTFKSLDLRHIHMSAEEKATEKTERRKA